jgi:2-dehydropantoate 2-reductase
VIGNQFGENGEREQAIAALLGKAMKSEISADIVGAKWTKLLLNIAGNSLTAITGLTGGEFAEQSDLCKIAVHIIREALDVVEQGEIELVGWTGFPVASFTGMVKAPLDEAAGHLGPAYGRNPTLLTSTLQSLLRGKPPEIDYLNGEIVRQGDALGVPTPFNAKAVELVHAVAQNRQFTSPEDATNDFSACISG